MNINIGDLRNVEVEEVKDSREVVIKLNEMDGNVYGTTSEIKITAKSYELLEEAIVEKWLAKKKDSI